MIRGLYTAVSGLITGEAKQSVITNNLANANTVGFKGENLAIKKFDEVLIQNYDKMVLGKNVKNVIGSLSMGSELDGVNTDFTQGMMEQTDKPTDFAIEGRGFFTVRRNDGVNANAYYTRNGHFHVNSQGYLVTDSGDQVLGRNLRTNAIEPIQVGDAKLQYDAAGNIRLDDEARYQFDLVDFQNYTELRKVGDNLYEGQNPIRNGNVNVRQHMLEKSNVNIINEMVNMMTVMRNFESNQKIVQAMDETLGKAANELGSVR